MSEPAATDARERDNAQAKPVPWAMSVVVPCYNEQGAVDSLVDRLKLLEQRLQGRGALETIFVDDGSVDRTAEEIEVASQRLLHPRRLRHGRNRGLTAAIMTGLGEARSPLVGVLDADGTYDPLVLVEMLEKMSPGVSAVTASPYHPDGHVENVAPWRLRISRFASWLYRWAFRNQLHTYTSCCRVLRRDDVLALRPTRDGFVGVTELLWRLDHAGKQIVEHPTTLRSRTVGASKLRVARVAWQHLGFLTQAAFARWTARSQGSSPSAPLNGW